MIRKARPQDAQTAAELALLLWPGNEYSALKEMFTELLGQSEAAVFLAYHDDAPIGFSQCQLRHDYVEGTDTNSVGYLEGIFVKESHRHCGYAKVLLASCESWAKQQGCTEFASDCELANTDSLRFHLSVGFEEANRIICFTKKL